MPPAPPRTPATRASARTNPPATAPTPSTRVRRTAAPAPPQTVKKTMRGKDYEKADLEPVAKSVPKPDIASNAVVSKSLETPSEDREPLKAYLRIRPSPTNPTHPPYLTAQSSTTVIAIPPAFLLRSTRPSTSYTFTHVFPPATSQDVFFSHVALPLVRSLLSGENGLLFAYGVSGAGKTWTIQGGNGKGEEGVVWRVLRSVMGSVRGQQGDVCLRIAGKSVMKDASARESLGSGLDAEEGEGDIVVDRNYSYSVFVSYAEVYNEKIFDLLDPTATSNPNKRKALALKSDPSGAGKYIHGLREVRVRSAAEAHAAFASGLLARQVSGTKVNHSSSRSHAVFSVRVVRMHKGRPNDSESLQSARLSIVDLAGSERTKATLATGDRLKESGSINKSLMVLGQCMEVLRANQRKLATAGGQGGGVVKLGLVPFRHSKLTELFQDFFIGEGRAVMVVNVNPYDGGYDEIVNVMRFSALARDIRTGPSYRSLAGLGGNVPKMIPEDVGESIPDDAQGTKEGDDDDDAEPGDPLVDHLFEELELMRLKLYDAEMRCAVIESETREEVTREMEGRMRAMERMFSERIMFDAEQNEAKIDSKIDLVNKVMIASWGGPPHDDDSGSNLTEIEDELIVEGDDSNIFLAGNSIVTSNVEDHDAAVDSQVDNGHQSTPDDGEDATGGEEDDEHEEDEDDEDEEEDEEKLASQSEEEWKPNRSEEDSPASTPSTPARRKSNRRTSTKANKSTTARVSKPATANLGSIAKPSDCDAGNVTKTSHDKENIHPASVKRSGGRKRSANVKVESTEQSLEHLEDVPDANAAAAKPSRGAPRITRTPTAKVKLEAAETTMIIPDKKARAEAVAQAGEGAVYVLGEGEVDMAKKKKRKLQAKSAVMTEEQILQIENGAEDIPRNQSGNMRRALRLGK